VTLDPASWREHAQGLEDGERRMYQHNCGPGFKLVVSRSGEWYNAWCYRCTEPGSLPAPRESLAARIARLQRQAAQDRATAACGLALPKPAVHPLAEWPPGVALWLLKAGLGAPEIAALGAYYHPPSDRVVLPVLDPSTGLPVFWQARSTNPHRLKYLSPDVPRASVVPRYGHAGAVTLTEDILSAFKVGLVAEGWSMMGTALTPRIVELLLQRGGPVNVWLDPDAAGRAGATKACRELRALGVPVRRIVSAKDPKNHSLLEIKELLCLR
jgi:DNA primase